MQNEQEKISRWLDLSGQKGEKAPYFPENKLFQLSLSLILEELIEAAESGSKEQTQEFLMSAKSFIDKSLNKTNDKKEGDVQELRDACADMRVVMGNLIHFSGLRDIFYNDLNAVMDSNFSKYCITEEEAKLSVELYAKGEHPNKMGEKIECYYDHVDEFFIVKKVGSGKILKSINYLEPIF